MPAGTVMANETGNFTGTAQGVGTVTRGAIGKPIGLNGGSVLRATVPTGDVLSGGPGVTLIARHFARAAQIIVAMAHRTGIQPPLGHRFTMEIRRSFYHPTLTVGVDVRIIYALGTGHQTEHTHESQSNNREQPVPGMGPISSK